MRRVRDPLSLGPVQGLRVYFGPPYHGRHQPVSLRDSRRARLSRELPGDPRAHARRALFRQHGDAGMREPSPRRRSDSSMRTSSDSLAHPPDAMLSSTTTRRRAICGCRRSHCRRPAIRSSRVPPHRLRPVGRRQRQCRLARPAVGSRVLRWIRPLHLHARRAHAGLPRPRALGRVWGQANALTSRCRRAALAESRLPETTHAS